MKELYDELTEDSEFDVGYFDSRQSSKVWVISAKDIAAMYEKKNGGEIFLWIQVCDAGESDYESPDRKRKKRKTSKCKDKEEELDEVFTKLRNEHGTNYTSPQLKLWAQMIICGTHDDYKDPPRVPMITGMQTKPPKKDSFTEALTGAAEAVAKAFTPQSHASVNTVGNSTGQGTSIGISPGKSTDLEPWPFG